MNRFNIVYCCAENSVELEHQYSQVNKYLKKIKVFHPKVLKDECGNGISVIKKTHFRELQYYLDNNRVDTLYVPSIKVLGADINIIGRFIIELYRSNVIFRVADKEERKIVQKFIREVHIASHNS